MSDEQQQRPAVRARRRAGQALPELAFALPVLITLFFGSFSFWSNFQQAQVYSKQAFSLAEWIGRSGVYTTTMRDTILAQLDASAAVHSANAYLYVRIVKPDASVIEIGNPGGVPASIVGNPPAAPAQTGWNSTSTITALPTGSQVQVDIWGYFKVEVPMLPISTWNIPLGHAVFYAVTGN